jgi:hypothetical protein
VELAFTPVQAAVDERPPPLKCGEVYAERSELRAGLGS